MALTKNVKLNDSSTAIAYRSKFDFAPANAAPVVTQGDVATSDVGGQNKEISRMANQTDIGGLDGDEVYYAGTLLAESFGNFTKLMTNGEGNYCTTAQVQALVLLLYVVAFPDHQPISGGQRHSRISRPSHQSRFG